MKNFATILITVILISLPITVKAVVDGFTVSVVVTELDTEAPTVPTSVLATAVSTSQIDVSWDASTDNVAVDGYKVFRDSTQIATTSSATLSYSDVGLSTATTYEYFIKAFDAANNISSSSATTSATTYSASVVEDTGSITGGYIAPSVSDIKLFVSAVDSRINFSADLKIGYILRWGKTATYESGALRSVIKKSSHSVYLPDLEPDTVYYYRLEVTNQFDQIVKVVEDSFLTQAEELPVVIPNASDFSASLLDNTASVKLEWSVPENNDYELRLLANPKFYPRHPADGYVIYEGRAGSVVDSDALFGVQQIYYTLFVVDKKGNYSSGVVQLVDKEEQIEPGGQDVADLPVLIMEDFKKVTFRQNGTDRLFRGDVADVLSQQDFVVLLSGLDLEPQYAVLRLANEFTLASYLMEPDYAQGVYTTGVPAMVAGEYEVTIQMYNRQGDLVSTIEGSLHVKSPEIFSAVGTSKLFAQAAGVSSVFLLIVWLLAGLRFVRRLYADN